VVDFTGSALGTIPDNISANITELDLTNNRLKNIEHLEHLVNLKKLSLRQNLIPKVEGLSNLTNLTHLDFYDNQLSVVENINFPLMTNLDLSFNNIRHIPPETLPLPSIKELYFVNNKVSEISTGVRGLTTLTLLELGSNRLRNLENLDQLVNLQQLWLGMNKITTIQNLDTLTKLERMSIQSNRIVEIGGLANLVSLQELYLSHNGITRLQGLDTLVNLTILDISNNKITKLENLTKLQKLEEFWFNDNQVESWEDLESQLVPITTLRTLYLEGNPLSKHGQYRQRIIHMFTALEQLDANIIRAPKH